MLDAFKLWSWRRLLRIPWTVRRSNQSMLKEISPEFSLEGLMLKLKLRYFGPPKCKELTRWKRLWCWERLKVGSKGRTGDGLVWWHHRLNGHAFVQTSGHSEGQGSLACCSPWGCRVRHDWTSEQQHLQSPEPFSSLMPLWMFMFSVPSYLPLA